MNTISNWGAIISAVAIIWSLFWKGLALWHSAKKGNKVWFIVLLLVNSLGLLDAYYLFGVEKVKNNKLFK